MLATSVRGIYPHRHETIVLSLVGEFQAKHDEKQVCYPCAFLYVTGTDIDHATVLVLGAGSVR
jgi:hypothetical protein